MFNRLLNRFGSKFYNSPQEYHACFEVTVKNVSKSSQRSNLIVPVISSNEYQSLISDTEYSPVPEINIEKEFKNQYSIFQIELDPGQSITTKQILKIKVFPRNRLAKKFKLTDYGLMDEKLKAPYLKLNEYLSPDEPAVLELAKHIQGKDNDLSKILVHINHWIIKNLSYGNPIQGLYRAKDVIRSFDKLRTTAEAVDCGGYSVLFISLCQAMGIPARIVSGFWSGYHMNDMHAWVEILLPDGSWMPADPATEALSKQGRSRKSGKLGFVGSDRVVLSVGCDLDLVVGEEEFATDILQNPIVYPENESLEVTRVFSTQPM
jgi:transglutaminase-like putative cysteine protease